jgi:2-phosphosulfolactate phosphatase
MHVPGSVLVHFLPSLISPGALHGGIAVVVDVLRATTVMIHALAAGCEAVIPCAEIDEARKIAAGLPAGSALLGGERHGVPIEGFDLGNSPSECTPKVCKGKTLVMTTTNGTRAILASLEAERVAIAAFSNLSATVKLLEVNLLKYQGLPVHIVCAGTEGFISLEDALLAGALTSRFRELGGSKGNDEAHMVDLMWRKTWSSADENLNRLTQMNLGRGGRNVRSVGRPQDISDAALIDRFSLTAEVIREPLRIVATQP